MTDPIVSAADLARQLNLALGEEDEAVLTSKIEAAQGCVENFIGTAFDEIEEPIPAPLKEAVLQLAAHLYENREAVIIGERANLVPWGVVDLVQPYRQWVF